MSQPLIHMRRSEFKQYKKWNIKESSTSVHFATTEDGWQVAISKYAANTKPAIKKKHPVLLCHGLACNRLAFDMREDFSFSKWLADQGYDVYAVDLRGHGLSQKPGAYSPLITPQKWGWGFNHYANHDLPTAMQYVLEDSGKSSLHFVGHSMGGLLLYALAAQQNAQIKSGITIGSSLDYSGHPSIFKKLAPLARFAQVLPFVPLNSAIKFNGLLSQISPRLIDSSLAHPDNVDIKDYQRLTANAFHPVSSPVLSDLARAITGEGINNEMGQPYHQLLKEKGYPFPILAISGEADSQCSPKIARRFGTEHKAFGPGNGQKQNYGHHDLIMGKTAQQEVWPHIDDWIRKHD